MRRDQNERMERIRRQLELLAFTVRAQNILLSELRRLVSPREQLPNGEPESPAEGDDPV